MTMQPFPNSALPPATVALLERLAAIQAGTNRCRQPVGVIGPGDGNVIECLAAYQVAHALAGAGMAIACGGRGGVMEGAARGANEAGGAAIGILPEEDLRAANRYLTLAIPTGMGEMRNALIARSCVCLVAIGGGMGTISEVALGLKMGKPVFALREDIVLSGTQNAPDVETLIAWSARWLAEDRLATTAP